MHRLLQWSGRLDSNQRPSAPKADALARLSYAPMRRTYNFSAKFSLHLPIKSEKTPDLKFELLFRPESKGAPSHLFNTNGEKAGLI